MRFVIYMKSLPGWKPPYEMLPGARIAPKW